MFCIFYKICLTNISDLFFSYKNNINIFYALNKLRSKLFEFILRKHYKTKRRTPR